MKLSYRGVNHDSQVTTIQTDLAGDGKYRGSSFKLHSPSTIATKTKTHRSGLTYRGLSY